VKIHFYCQKIFFFEISRIFFKKKSSERNVAALETTRSHEHSDLVVGDETLSPLVVGDEFEDDISENLLDLLGEHLSTAVILADLLKFGIILQEEGEPLIGDVNLQVCTLFFVFLKSGTSTTECKVLDLVLNISWRVGEKNGAGGDGGSHLGLGTKKRGEELGVDESRFDVTESGSDVSGHSEVRVLVDCLRNQAEQVGVLLKYVRKSVGEGRSRLHGWKRPLSNRV